MSLIKSFFDRENVDSITSEDLIKFFSKEQEESDVIEFKSFVEFESEKKKSIDDRENDILQCICAMLNTEGGIIIWGAPKGVKSKNKKLIFRGELTPFEKSYDKDAFIAKTANRIIPSPSGIRFRKLNFDEKYIYIIEVDKSYQSPHQFKNVYFMRLDGQTVPAPHQYVEALFKKISFPNIKLYLMPHQLINHGVKSTFYFSIYVVNYSKFQNELNFSYRILFSQGILYGNPSFYTNETSILNGGLELRKKINDVISLGMLIDEPHNIVFENSKLSKDNIITMAIQFNGRYSPSRSCFYKLNINFDSIKPNVEIFEAEENFFAYERQDEKSTNNEHEILKLIGR